MDQPRQTGKGVKRHTRARASQMHPSLLMLELDTFRQSAGQNLLSRRPQGWTKRSRTKRRSRRYKLLLKRYFSFGSTSQAQILSSSSLLVERQKRCRRRHTVCARKTSTQATSHRASDQKFSRPHADDLPKVVRKEATCRSAGVIAALRMTVRV